MAGYALWFSVYPIDVVKSKIQSGAGPFKGMIDCFSQTWSKQRVKGFTNGLIPTLVRSPFGAFNSDLRSWFANTNLPTDLSPANGATFLFFEMTMRALQ